MPTHLETVIAPLSIEYRGRFIHETIMIEKHVDECLMLHFCVDNDTRLEFASLILDRLNVDGKIAALEQIVKSREPDFNKKYKKLFGELRFIKDQRNIFAHHMLDVFVTEAEASKTTDVTLIDFRNKATFNTYTKEAFEKLIDRLKRCDIEINELKKVLVKYHSKR